MFSATASTLSIRFGIFIHALTQALGNACTPRAPRADIAVISLFYRRILRHLRRFKRFAEAADPAALNPKPRNRRPRDPDQPLPERSRPRPILPRGFGWLRKIVPELTATPGISAAAGLLRAILQDPELQALLNAAPTLARTLRPLCHALGIRTLGTDRPLPFPPKQPRKPASAATIPPTPPPSPHPVSQKPA